MTIIVPNAGETAIANKFLNQALTLKLYSNDIIPDEDTTTATLVEVTGGGYAAVPLVFASWVVSAGIAYYTPIPFAFTGATGGPGSVYGYYVVDASNVLLWAERFPTSVLPFIPVNHSLILITPRLQVS
jgi:hypothetical protein